MWKKELVVTNNAIGKAGGNVIESDPGASEAPVGRQDREIVARLATAGQEKEHMGAGGNYGADGRKGV